MSDNGIYQINLFAGFLTHSIMIFCAGLTEYCIQLYFEVLKFLLYSPAGGYLCYFKFAHSSTQTRLIVNTNQDVYLKDAILALSWGA